MNQYTLTTIFILMVGVSSVICKTISELIFQIFFLFCPKKTLPKNLLRDYNKYGFSYDVGKRIKDKYKTEVSWINNKNGEMTYIPSKYTANFVGKYIIWLYK